MPVPTVSTRSGVPRTVTGFEKVTETSMVPSGASLTTAAASAAVALAHGAVHDPARLVDAVPPAIDAAIVAGPVLTLTWTEALDPDSIPDGAGGFTVRIMVTRLPSVPTPARMSESVNGSPPTTETS